jgi:hypothetical protein
MNALISAVFPVMAARSGAVPFALFAVMMLVRFLIVLTLYPETNGVSLEKMEHHLCKLFIFGGHEEPGPSHCLRRSSFRRRFS